MVYRLNGGYFTTPRWGREIRKGRMSGKVAAIVTPEELSAMSAQDIQSLIKNGLMTDAYEEQKENPVLFKSNVRAEYLESLLFICPKCQKTGTLTSKKDELTCSCGYRLTMDEYGYLCDEYNKKHTITELFDDQKMYLTKIKDNTLDRSIWSDNVQLIKLKRDHSIVSKESVIISAFKDHLMINNEKLPIDHIVSIDIVQRNRLIIHINNSDVRYEFTGENAFNAVKYRIWFQISSS